MMWSADLESAFHLAIKEARQFEGATAPNPIVGAAILSEKGQLLSVGAHHKAGSAHAEVVALDLLQKTDGDFYRQAHTLLVTLEPCHHFGKTPPCTQAILDSPIKRVIYGQKDPNPKVNGGGSQALSEKGISVYSLGELNTQINESINRVLNSIQILNRPFFKWVTTGLPWVTVKTAHRFETVESFKYWAEAIQSPGPLFSEKILYQKLKETMIPPVGTATFTSSSSLTFAHLERKKSDALLTGAGTVLADHPRFDVRHIPDHRDKWRDLVIIEGTRKTPPAYIDQAMTRRLRIKQISGENMFFNAVLQAIGSTGNIRLLVETGPKLTDFILSSSLWDEHMLILHLSSQVNSRTEDEVHHVYRNY